MKHRQSQSALLASRPKCKIAVHFHGFCLQLIANSSQLPVTCSIFVLPENRAQCAGHGKYIILRCFIQCMYMYIEYRA